MSLYFNQELHQNGNCGCHSQYSFDFPQKLISGFSNYYGTHYAHNIGPKIFGNGNENTNMDSNQRFNDRHSPHCPSRMHPFMYPHNRAHVHCKKRSYSQESRQRAVTCECKFNVARVDDNQTRRFDANNVESPTVNESGNKSCAENKEILLEGEAIIKPTNDRFFEILWNKLNQNDLEFEFEASVDHVREDDAITSNLVVDGQITSLLPDRKTKGEMETKADLKTKSDSETKANFETSPDFKMFGDLQAGHGSRQLTSRSSLSPKRSSLSPARVLDSEQDESCASPIKSHRSVTIEVPTISDVKSDVSSGRRKLSRKVTKEQNEDVLDLLTERSLKSLSDKKSSKASTDRMSRESVKMTSSKSSPKSDLSAKSLSHRSDIASSKSKRYPLQSPRSLLLQLPLACKSQRQTSSKSTTRLGKKAPIPRSTTDSRRTPHQTPKGPKSPIPKKLHGFDPYGRPISRTSQQSTPTRIRLTSSLMKRLFPPIKQNVDSDLDSNRGYHCDRYIKRMEYFSRWNTDRIAAQKRNKQLVDLNKLLYVDTFRPVHEKPPSPRMSCFAKPRRPRYRGRILLAERSKSEESPSLISLTDSDNADVSSKHSSSTES